MEVGVTVGSEDLNTGQRGQWVRTDHQLHCNQLTCMTEPQAREQLQLWVLKT